MYLKILYTSRISEDDFLNGPIRMNIIENLIPRSALEIPINWVYLRDHPFTKHALNCCRAMMCIEL